MPNFDKLKFTNKGFELQIQAQAGNELKFSKIKLGSGTHTGDTENLSDLINPILEAEIIFGTLSNKTYTVEASFSNNGLEVGFYWNEIGLYAKDSNGNDVLYAYASASGSTDYIPSQSESAYLKKVKIAVIVGNATNVTFVQSDHTYVDVLTFNEKMSDVLNQLSNIKKDLSGYVSTTDFNEFKTKTTDKIESIEKSIITINEDFTKFKDNIMGDASIAHIGAGTVTGAIVELFRLINEIPTITSGTSEPTGGEDGDVYIMYE